MATYINKAWTERDYEITNVIMQTCDGAPRNMNGSDDAAGNWIEVDAQEVSDMAELTGMGYAEYRGFATLGGFADHRFYGYI